jgi:hypothetical protein
MMMIGKGQAIIAFELRGTIRSSMMEPLAGVTIYFDEPEYKLDKDRIRRVFNFAITNKKGQFVWHSQAQILFVRHSGFRPLVQKIPKGESKVIVTLEPNAEAPLQMGSCLKVDRNSKGLDHLKMHYSGIVLFFPHESNYFIEHDMGYLNHLIYFGVKENHELLGINEGPQLIGYPNLKNFLSAQEVSTRSINCGKEEGIDIRWKNYKGKYSRWIGFVTCGIGYDEVSKPASDYFDKIIDSMCCEQMGP